LSHHREWKPRGARLFILIYLTLAAGIVASAEYFHRSYAQHFRQGVEQQLASIAALKVSELQQYRAERLGDGAILFENPVFSDLVRRMLEQPGDTGAQGQLQVWLGKFKYHYDYTSALLLDTSGKPWLSIPEVPTPVPSVDAKLVSDVLAGRKVVFQDFTRAEQDQRIYCSVIVPIFDELVSHRALGVVVLQIDPNTHLYPFIARWPTPSESAETLLVRRDGDYALFLNELKFRKGTALTLRVPIERGDVAAVKAVLGRTGTVEADDYRDTPVIAYLTSVPQSPWFLVARVDRDEVFKPLEDRLRQTIGAVVVLLLAAGAGLGLIWRQRAALHYQEQAARAAALAALSSHQEVLLSTVPDIIMEVNINQVYTWSNPAGLEFFGPDVLGRNAAFYFEGEQATLQTVQPIFDGDDRMLYVESWQRRKDGEKRLLAWRCGTLRQSDGAVVGALSCARDVTEQRKAEQELAVRVRVAEVFLTASDAEMYDAVLKVILETMQSPVGIFGHVNESEELVIASEITGDGEEGPVPPGTQKAPRFDWESNIWTCALRDKLWSTTNELRTTSTGKLALKRQICVPILLRGQAVGLFQVANRDTDYTKDDLRILETIAEYVAPVLHARLQRQQREAELQQRNDEMMRFTYTASHDLKSPLVTVTTFLGYLESDIKKQAEEAVSKDFEFIRNATIKMSQLLDELLDLSRVGRKPNPSVEVALQDVVREALDLTAGRLSERGINVQVTDEPLVLYGDRSRIVEVFQNLIDNAAKFMGEQAEPRVDIGVESTRNGLVIFIRDNGIGIDPRHKGKLFGLFEKLDPHTEGTGMGLALIQRIVQTHGGKIWVESDGPGCGTTFRFTLARTRRAAKKERTS
jgi:PAS domain S-box-containing protein